MFQIETTACDAQLELGEQKRTSRLREKRHTLSSILRRGGLPGLVGMVGRGLGIALRFRAHRRWMATIGGETTKKILEVYPRIAFRHSTTYLFEGASWHQRLLLLQTHYAFLNRTCDATFFESVIEPAGLELWRGPSGDDPSIKLVGPCRVSRHREGELGLNFSINEVVVYKLAFSVVPLGALANDETSGLGLSVGQVQGSPDSRELLRDAAKLCDGIAPRDLLMRALVGIAQAWNMDRILGVGADLVLSRDSCSFDYNAFWEQYGGEPTASGHYAMTLPFHVGPVRASSSAHRRRTRRKRQFQAQVSESVAIAMTQELRLPVMASVVDQVKVLEGAIGAARHAFVDGLREAA